MTLKTMAGVVSEDEIQKMIEEEQKRLTGEYLQGIKEGSFKTGEFVDSQEKAREE